MDAGPAERVAVTPAPGPGSVARTILRNAASLTVGRFLLALLRFGVALVIVRRAGLDAYGQFALLMSLVLLAEWLSDFGLGDIAVRQLLAAPERGRSTLRAFALAKAGQAVASAALLCLGVSLAGYPQSLVSAVLLAAVSIVLYGGVQFFRVGFRARMVMERDICAEVLSALVLLGSIWVVSAAGASLSGLALCYVASRAVNLLVAWALSVDGASGAAGPPEHIREELRVLLAASLPLGTTGLLVCAYDAMDAIALTSASTPAQVGIFSVAARVMMLVVLVEQALASAVFPVLSAQWARERARFLATYQTVLDYGMLMGGALFCGLFAAAEWVGTLARQDGASIATVLHVLSWAIFARVVVTLVSPMVVIAGKLMTTVWISALVVAAKMLALAWLASRGAIGAAWAYLIAEVGVGLVPTVLLCQRSADVHLAWASAMKSAGAAVAVAVATLALGLKGNPLHALLAVMAYVAIAWAIGAVRPQMVRDFHLLIARRKGGA